MAVYADLRLIQASNLSELVTYSKTKRFLVWKASDQFIPTLDKITEPLLKDEDYDGYAYLDLLEFLKEQKRIDLLNNPYEAELKAITKNRKGFYYVLTYQHKQQYLGQLLKMNIDLGELQQFNIKLSENSDLEYAMEQKEAYHQIVESLSLLTSDSQVIFMSIE